MSSLDLSNFDFIDFGASKGGSIEFGKIAFDGKRGLGIDLNPNKVEIMKSQGLDAEIGDFTNLPYPDKSFKFAILSHVLEHLPSLDHAKKALKEAMRLSTDFVFFQGPFFEADEYLEKLGLKFYWSDWHGHTCHFSVRDMENILNELGVSKNDYKIFLRIPVEDSNSPFIHPLNSPPDQHDYDPNIHPPKHHIKFSGPLFREFVCYIKMRELDSWDKLIKKRKNPHQVDEFKSWYSKIQL